MQPREAHQFVPRPIFLISKPPPQPQSRKQLLDPSGILHPVLDFLPHFVLPPARPSLPANHLFIRNQPASLLGTLAPPSRFSRQPRRPFSTHPQNRLHPLKVPRARVVQRVFLVYRGFAFGVKLPQPPEQPRQVLHLQLYFYFPLRCHRPHSMRASVSASAAISHKPPLPSIFTR